MNLNMLYCYLTNQHEYNVQCQPHEIYLRCIHCGRRSSGWALKGAQPAASQAAIPVEKRDAAAGKKKRPARSTAPVAASV